MRPLVAFVLASLLLGTIGSPAARAQTASLRRLGVQPAPRPSSVVTAVSEDGSVVAGVVHSQACTGTGYCFPTSLWAFRQVGSDPLELLPLLPTSRLRPESMATAVSGDGLLTFGWSDAEASYGEACRWQEGGVASLGFDRDAAPRGASHDGSALIVLGAVMRDGSLEAMPGIFPGDVTAASALSPDARVVAGSVRRGDETTTRAAVWVDGIPSELANPAGLVDGRALAVSDDGRVAAGRAEIPGDYLPHAVVWVDGVPRAIEATLPPLQPPLQPHQVASEAIGVSGDGRVVLVNLFTSSPVIEPDAAHLWDEANGLRRLADVLRADFRLGYELLAYGPASAISRDGHTIVGFGPGYPRQGWVATLPDGCANGLDDDGDGLVDLADPGCADATDYTERGPGPACDDGLDNEGDWLFDFPDDPSCASPGQAFEGDCTDGLDNDFDGLVDLEDPGCSGASDPDEKTPLLPCDDGVDNDQDGWFDTYFDEGCASPYWPSESPACSDGVDNDGDGLFDWWEDPNCEGAPSGLREAPPGACGLGMELALLAPALARLSRLRGRAARTR